MKQKSRHIDFEEISVTGCTGSCSVTKISAKWYFLYNVTERNSHTPTDSLMHNVRRYENVQWVISHLWPFVWERYIRAVLQRSSWWKQVKESIDIIDDVVLCRLNHNIYVPSPMNYCISIRDRLGYLPGIYISYKGVHTVQTGDHHHLIMRPEQNGRYFAYDIFNLVCFIVGFI